MRQIKLFNSAIFGAVMQADHDEKEKIRDLVNKYPVDVFAAVNKKMNRHGFCLAISAESEIEFPGFQQIGSNEEH